MMKNSTQQTKHIVYKHSPGNSNSMQNGGIQPTSSSTPYSSNDLNKEGYNVPIIPPSTSYVDYSKQYSSMSGGTKMSTKADTLSSHQKSVVSASPIVATYDYSPFGQLIATSGTPELSPIQFSSENHRRHVGDLDKRATRSLPLQEVSHRSEAGEAMTNQIFDPEIALTYYNHRYYNPTDGRWLSRDPAGESASLNLYAFVKNASHYRTDYLGLVLPPGDPAGLPGIETRTEILIPINGILLMRNEIRFKLAIREAKGEDIREDTYGHWWVEIDGNESYGWWPAEILSGTMETIIGVMGRLNGTDYAFSNSENGIPSSTKDAKHGENPRSKYSVIGVKNVKQKLEHGKGKNKVCGCGITEEDYKDCIRKFAKSFSGGWSYPAGPNCHTFQEDMLTSCCLKKMDK